MAFWHWQSHNLRLVLLVIGGLFALLGGLLVVIHIQQNARLATMQRTWQQTQAVITRSQVHSVWDRNMVMYQPDVTYVYRHGGRTYQGDALEPFSNNYRTSSSSSVRRRLIPYQEGMTVPLYFDPQDPGQSALSLTRSSPPLFLWIGAPFFLLGLGGLLTGARWVMAGTT